MREEPPHMFNPTASTTYTPRGVSDFPIAGTRYAPKTFRGKADEVDRFLRHYQRLCERCGVASPKEKLENLTQYCSRHVREFCEALEPYRTWDWTEFLRQFRELFNADRDDRRFRIKDLERFVQLARQEDSMRDLRSWRRYKRGHIRIAGWLQQRKKITDDDYNTYFWKGIPKAFRERLENRLMGQHPTHDITRPFTFDQIEKAAKSLLQADRFDRERMPSDDEEDSDEEEDLAFSSDEEASVASDDDREGNQILKRLASRVAATAKDKHEDKDRKKKTEDKGKKEKDGVSKTPKQEKEVADLIDKMSKMSISDPAYVTHYYRALCLDTRVEKILAPPAQATPARPGTSQSFRSQPPQVTGASPRYAQERRCFGCGDAKHIGAACPKLAELVQKGIIARDADGRYAMKDGARIWRNTRDETLVDAAVRQSSAQTHYIRAEESDWEDEESFNEAYPVLGETSDDDEYYYPVYTGASRDRTVEVEEPNYYQSEGETYAAERSERAIRAARREAQSTARPAPRTRNASTPEPRTPPAPSRAARDERRPRFVSKPVPIDMQKPTFNPADEDAYMDEDVPMAKTQTRAPTPGPAPSERREPPRPPTPATRQQYAPGKSGAADKSSEKRQPRASELQSHTDQKGIIKKILQTPITLEFRDILGSSREMAHEIGRAHV